MRIHEGKLYLSYRDIHGTVARLAGQILSSGYDPTRPWPSAPRLHPARILKTYLRKPILTVGIVYDHNNTPWSSPAPSSGSTR
jgi:hypoxanthine phosphoribosyltransferase